MELLRLSAELLLQILGYLGPAFFAADLARLSLSRRWYSFARQVFRQRLQLSLLAIPRLSRYAEDPEIRAEICRCARSIDVWVPSIDEWLLPVAAPNEEGDGRDDYWPLLKEKVQELRMSFSNVIDMLGGCRALRSFRISAHAFSMYYSPDSFHPFLHTPTLASFLSFSNITSLELDIGYLPNDARDKDESKIHVCALVNSLLPKLRRLRYRMATLCEQLLVMPPGDSKLDLEELIINLGFFGGDRRHERPIPTSHCRTPLAGLLQVYLRPRLQKVVKRLANPKTVGVISHEPRLNQTHFFDALTEDLLLLAPGTGPWEVSGGELVESGVERLFPDWYIGRHGSHGWCQN
jgi:hypothetical protein